MSKIKFPKKLRSKWLKALRSNNYMQGDGLLRNPCDESYCCLGVLAKEAGIDDSELDNIGDFTGREFKFDLITKIPKSLVQYNIKKKTRKNTKFCDILISMNDDGDDTFNEIADYIEQKTVGV